MLTKTIKVSEGTHKVLSGFASKNDTFNDVIVHLIRSYAKTEEFTLKQAFLYNEEIERIENGVLENVNKITLDEIEERIAKLEHEIKNDV